jgi:hypothetical protein
LYFICSDDKPKSSKPDSLYTPQILEGLGDGLANVKVLKCLFVGFEHHGDYSALDAFDLQDFLMQDVAELFYA